MTHSQEADLRDTVDLLYRRLVILEKRFATNPNRRILVALAGGPGSGKSTITAALARTYEQREKKSLAILPMDGFHFPKSTLHTFEDPEEAFRRRGAPFTFDADAFICLIKTLKDKPVIHSTDPRDSIRAPSFDHSVKDPVEDDISISSADRVVIIEGNYLLLDEKPWRDIAALVDERWYIDVLENIAKDRLMDRHLRAGIESTREAAARRAEDNDLKNLRLVRRKLITPDVIIQN